MKLGCGPAPSEPIEPGSSPRLRGSTNWRLLLILFGPLVGVGIAFYLGCHRKGIEQASLPSGPTAVVIASFQQDFQPDQPTNGWRYLWNAHGPLGQETNYAALRWDGERFCPEGSPSYPAQPPARFLRITWIGGHPGNGYGQGFREVGNELPRYAIIAFTAPESGDYSIVESRLGRPAGPLGGSIELRVFVNNGEIGPPLQCRSRAGLNFDRELGRIEKKSTVYVAIGPNETDVDDSFELDFAIARR